MKPDITYSKLQEMKKMSYGDPQRIAAYTMAQRRYDETIAQYFNEETGVKFYTHPTESYVEQLEKKAAKTGNYDDKARAVIARDKFEHIEKESVKPVDWRISKQNLRELLVEGGEVTRKDVDEAYRVAKLSGTTESQVVYAQLKRKYEEAEGVGA